MNVLVFQWSLAIVLVCMAIIDTEAILRLGTRLDGYLTLGWKWASIAPAYVRMIILQRYMLWKMRRQFKANFPSPKI